MGRELKRVALDFEWPMNKVWEGFLNPYYKESYNCPHCDGTGSSPEARRLKDLWYGYIPFKPEDRWSRPFVPSDEVIKALALRNVSDAPEYYGTGLISERSEAQRLCDLFNSSWSYHVNSDDVAALVEGGRLVDFTHTWTREEGWKPKEPPYIPTPQEVNEWSVSTMGHDSVNQWIVTGAECKRLGVPELCTHCEGEGTVWLSPEAEQAADEWKPTEPPAGEGYQIWETVSEGSPISPVFATPEALAEYMAGREWGADKGTSYEAWLAFIRGPGWAPSMVMDSSGVRTGVQDLEKP